MATIAPTQLGSYPTAPPISGGGFLSASQIPSIPISQSAFQNPVNSTGQFAGQLNNYLGNTTAPVQAQQAQQASAPGFAPSMAGEQQLASQYGQMAQGNGPSLAQVTANQQGAQNLQQAMSLLGSARGSGNPAQAQLQALNAQAQGGQQVAQNAVAGRTQEEMGALGAQGSLLGNIAGQGLQAQQQGNQLAQFNAGQGNQVGMSNQANTTQANTALLNQLAQQNAQTQAGAQAGQTLNAQTQLGTQGLQEQANAANASATQAFLGTLMSPISGFASALGNAVGKPSGNGNGGGGGGS